MVVPAKQALRCAITSLSAAQPASSLDARNARRLRLAEDLRRWIVQGVEFIQLREKFLEAGEIFALAEQAMALLHASVASSRPRLLVNGRPDIAAAARADGVHLTSRPGEVLPSQAREIFRRCGLGTSFVSTSCHTLEEVVQARDRGADLILFGPVFEKQVAGAQVHAGVGLRRLQEACLQAGPVPILALGGVTPGNTAACRGAGAAGVAGIRLFG